MYSVGGHQFRVASRLAMAGLLALLIGGCTGGALDKIMNPPNTDVPDVVSGADLTARTPTPTSNRLRDPAGMPAAIYNDGGDGESAAAGGDPRSPTMPGQEVTQSGSGYDINFQNADINAVTKVILGDLLKVTYSVDPRVQGTLSLSSGRPIARQDLLPTFESAVKIVNANVVRESGIYKVVPIGEALGNGEIDAGRLTPGYGISVLPIKYISAQTVLRAIDSFAAKPGQVRVEPSRNLLLVQGTSAERQSAIDAALALDADWMKNQSVGVFPVRNASPDTVIKELENVFDSGREGAGQRLVKFQPINRLNAVLAVGQNARVIDQVKTWVARLDKADYENTTVRVYKLRYGNARQVAAILRDVFTGQGSGGSLGNQDMSQLTPGSSFTRQSSMGGSSTSSGGSSSTTQSNTQQINTPAFGGGGGGTGDPDSGAGRVGEPSGRGGRGATGVDLSSLSGGGGNSGPAPLPNVRITPDVANNSLLIYASRDQYKMVERAIFELDKAPMQVAIDVTVAEVTLKNQLQYGIQYYFSDGSVPGSIGFGTGGINNAGKLLLSRMPGANFILGSDSDPRIVLDALRTVTDVKVLSAPALVVVDNQPAVLQVGDQVPIITAQATTVTTANPALVNSIERHDTGVILKVIPRINANGVVNLDVSQEVSAVVPGTNNAQTGPTISQRRVQSTVAVASGQTVLLGGLISSSQNTTRKSVPILGDIKGPIGDLFATNDKTNDRTELILFIRPQIIRNGLDAQLVAEELRSKLQTIARGTTVERQIEQSRPTSLFRQ